MKVDIHIQENTRAQITMLRKWLLPRIDLSECKFERMPTDWEFSEIPELDERLKICKSRIDKPYAENPRQWEELTILLEPSRMIRDTMRVRFDPQNVTNAWLKLIEIFSEFGIGMNDAPLKMFDNASAPGAFIMAAHYWKKCVYPGKFTWMASSWRADPKVALGDTYGLAATFPERFTTNVKTANGFEPRFNGDTMDVRYLRYMEDAYSSSFNLYTSDLGMAIPAGKYNCQEAVNARGNLGQILMGLLTLAIGGTLITKQFSHMSSFTISLMAIVSAVFEKTYVVKPLTSKPDNSEEYLVGLGYLGTPQHLKDIMYDFLEETNTEYNIDTRNFLPPLLSRECVPFGFERAIIDMTRSLVDNQCAKIDANIREYERMISNHKKFPSKEFVAANLNADIIERWIARAPFKVMSKSSDYMKLRASTEPSRAGRKTRKSAKNTD